jgi:hypothetical protein
MPLAEFDAASPQSEQREPALDPPSQAPPRRDAFGALYSDPRPSVFAFHEAAAAGPPLVLPQIQRLPVAPITPHFEVLGASKIVLTGSEPMEVCSVTPYIAAVSYTHLTLPTID